MPGLYSGNQIVREDLSDAFLQSDVKKTPVTSRVRKGEKLKNFALYSWAIEKMDGRSVAGIPENQDVSSFEGDQQFQLFNRGQKFRRSYLSTTEANEVNVAPADFGKYTKLVTKKVREQQRDVEVRYLDDQVSSTDNGTTGNQFYGMGAVINDGVSIGSSQAAITFTDTQTSIPAAFRTPTAQIYVGNLATGGGFNNTGFTPVFSEESLLTILQSRYDNLGAMDELTMYADSVLKRYMSRMFTKYKQNVQGYTAIVRTEQEAIEAKKYSIYGADVYQTDFGNMMVELMQWAPKLSIATLTTDVAGVTPSGRGYIFNMDQLKLRPSGRWLTQKDMEDRGAGPRGFVESMIGHEFGDPRTHCKIDPIIALNT